MTIFLLLKSESTASPKTRLVVFLVMDLEDLRSLLLTFTVNFAVVVDFNMPLD